MWLKMVQYISCVKPAHLFFQLSFFLHRICSIICMHEGKKIIFQIEFKVYNFIYNESGLFDDSNEKFLNLVSFSHK